MNYWVSAIWVWGMDFGLDGLWVWLAISGLASLFCLPIVVLVKVLDGWGPKPPFTFKFVPFGWDERVSPIVGYADEGLYPGDVIEINPATGKWRKVR